MKYKKKSLYKRGGSPIQPNQPNQPIQVSVKETSISDSIKNTFLNTKDIFNEIKIYVKSNFIFVLFSGILIIFYIYLMMTDPLTEEDLQESVETIYCDTPLRGWTSGCPNKTLAVGKECINNQCDEDTCCVNELSCSEWQGNCRGDDFAIKGSNTCSPDIGNCSDKCCAKTCSQFLNSLCPNNKIKIPTNFCNIPNGSQEYLCSYNECCSEQLTCATFLESDCLPGQMLSNTAASITCDNNNCTPNICCEEISTTQVEGSTQDSDDSGPDDSGPDDSGPDDSGPDDSGAVDSGAVDSGGG